jgi:hypothetical protein
LGKRAPFIGALFLPCDQPFLAAMVRSMRTMVVLNRIALIRTKDSLVFRRVQGILVSNDASAMQQFARAVP